MVTALTGDDGVDRPDAIESLSPVENAVQVLQQEGIVVDFQYGYEAGLSIDGTEIPVTRSTTSRSNRASRSTCRRRPCSSPATPS